MRQPKIFNIILVLFLSTQYAHGQVSITAIQPVSPFTIDDLWQVTLIKNPTLSQPLWTSVTLVLSNEKGKKLLTESTAKFELNKATYIITRTNLQEIGPIKQQYYDSKFQSTVSKQGGLVPAGSYRVEFFCSTYGTATGEGLGDGSTSTSYIINVQPMSPIQLVQVYNKETIKAQYPLFTWLPPFPLPPGTQLDYEFTLTQLKPNQSAGTALMANQPLHRMKVGNKLSLYYASNLPRLVKGDEYAWKVRAYERNQLVSESESWEFKYGDEVDSIIPEQYFVMERELKGSFVTIDSNLLPIKFVEDYKVLDSISHMYLYDDAFNVIGDETNLPLAYHTGSNYTYLNFCPDIFPIPTGMFVLEIALINEEHLYLRFNNISNPNACY